MSETHKDLGQVAYDAMTAHMDRYAPGAKNLAYEDEMEEMKVYCRAISNAVIRELMDRAGGLDVIQITSADLDFEYKCCLDEWLESHLSTGPVTTSAHVCNL